MARLSIEQFNELVEMLYRSALDEGLWSGMLQMLAERIGGACVALHAHDSLTNENIGIVGGNWDPAFMQSYREYYAAINPWNRAAHGAPDGLAMASEALLNRDDLRRSQFYNEWIRPQDDIGTGAGVTIWRSGPRFWRLSCNLRIKDQDQHQNDLITTLNLLAPHLMMSINVSRRIRGENLSANAIQILDRVHSSIFLLDRRGRYHHCNKAAEELIKRGLISVNKYRCIDVSDPSSDKILKHAIAAAISRDYFMMPKSILIRDQNSNNFTAIVMPMTYAPDARADFMYFDADVSAVICISQNSSSSLTVDLLQRIFGLTASEAELSYALCRGRSLKAYSHDRGIKEGTARKQLATVFQKTDTHQQSQLVAKITRYARPPSD